MTGYPVPSSSGLELFLLPTKDDINLQIRHAVPPPDRPCGHVVLIHGASASYTTFTVPRHNSLSDALRKQGFDVWFLDWRGSHEVSRYYLDESRAEKHVNKFKIDCVAEIDIPTALKEILERVRGYAKGAKSLQVVAHCLGSGALAQSIADDRLAGVDLTHVVFSTLGLFYEVTFDNAMKAKDYVLEKIRNLPCYFIAPEETPWPDKFEEDFTKWERMLSPECFPLENGRLCRRLSFMYGIPYLHEQLTPELHDPEALEKQFGPIPIEMYIQAGQNVRRRWAAPYGEGGDCPKFISDDARKRFAGMHVTLITGTRNTLWHRDSIDRMYEWLRRGGVLRGPEMPASEGRNGTVEKVVIPDFGHQDLLWGKKAPEKVFGEIVRALRK
jgi:pimeloyl-ACP methyl ester carboxylesterase